MDVDGAMEVSLLKLSNRLIYNDLNFHISTFSFQIEYKQPF